MRCPLLVLGLALAAARGALPAAALPSGAGRPALHREWLRDRLTADTGVPSGPTAALAVLPDGSVLAASGGRVWCRVGHRWRKEPGPSGVRALAGSGDGALAAADDGIWRRAGGRWTRQAGSPAHGVALARCGSAWWAVTGRGAAEPARVWRGSGRWDALGALPAGAGDPACIAAAPGARFVGASAGLFRSAGGGAAWERQAEPAGGPLLTAVRGLALLGSTHVIAASATGLRVGTPAGGWRAVGPRDGLPVSDLACAAVGPDGAVWLGSAAGLIRWRDGEWRYFAGPRWLPDDRVRCVAPAEDGSIWVGTARGPAHLRLESLTLAEKAGRYQRDLEARPRRFGYVTVMHLSAPGRRTGSLQEISDNDGLWTAMYVGSQCLRYAVTHSPAARAQARRSMEAILRLERITGISGFPARAISSEREPGFATRSEGEWNRSAVEPGWWWKGDTSSDEIDGHYFAFLLYHDLAATPAEKAQVRETCRRVTDHLLDHGLYLVGAGGRRTKWGVWAPERLNDDPEWAEERGLNSLEILSHLKVAIHLVGDRRYQRAYDELIRQHGYALNTLGVKRLPPDGEVNHSDDELAFLAFYPLLRLERDPALVALYRAGLRRTWEAVRTEECPLWNFIYGACTGAPCDTAAGVRALEQIPLDLIRWPVRNSLREDLRRDPMPDRFGEQQLLRPLAWTERPLHKWNGNPFAIDGGDARAEEDPTFWLLPYWLGRYHRLIE